MIFKRGIIFFLFLLIIMIHSGFAGTRGKLAGTVTDKATGEPLPGVNVYLQNTSFGAATDEEGQFIILNLCPGTYTVWVEYIGYTTLQFNGVAISTDLTTILNIELTVKTFESDETIIIIADRPLFRKDATSKMAVIGGDEIISMPVDNFNDVVASQAGITTDANGNLHFRGGRTNEVTFLIDGQPVENPGSGSFSGMIDNYAIRELQVLSGTFNAEYGQAMSGIINIITKDGSEKIRSKIEYTSPILNASPYRKTNALVDDSNPIYDKQTGERLTYQDINGLDVVEPYYPYQGSFNGFFSGPLPAGLGSFFLSGDYTNINSWKPFGYNFSRSVFGKMTFPFAAHKLSISLQASDENNQPYNHKYKYLPNNYGHWEVQSKRYAVQYNHVFSKNSYLIFNTSYLDHASLFRVADLHYKDYIFPEPDENLEFMISGNSKAYTDLKSKTYNIKADWVFQYGTHHEFKSGFDFSQYEMDVFNYSNEGNTEDEFFLNQYNKKPVTASVYIQDKIEYETIILNAGLRADYVDVKAEAYKDIENPYSGLIDTKPEFKFSPRLGLAYPISEKTVFHFSYGHFFQFPDFNNIYYNLQFLNPEELKRAKLAIVANPNVKSQKTTSYEFGLSHKLSNNSALKLTAYSKDITNLLGTIYVETSTRYIIFTNNDFARIQGVDISYEKRMSDYWAAKFDYSFSIARGNEATATEEAFNIFRGRERSVKEFYLDFDRRHDFSLNLSLFLPKEVGPEFLNTYPFANLKLSLLGQFSSGLPYTPISDDRTKYFEKNSARMPWTKTLDFRLEKFLNVSQMAFTVFVEATNIFDWLNPVVVQPRTGELWDDGKSYLFGSGKDYMHDPNDVIAPRIVRIGTSIAL